MHSLEGGLADGPDGGEWGILGRVFPVLGYGKERSKNGYRGVKSGLVGVDCQGDGYKFPENFPVS